MVTVVLITRNQTLFIRFAWIKYIADWVRSGPGFFAAINVSKKCRAGRQYPLTQCHNIIVVTTCSSDQIIIVINYALHVPINCRNYTVFVLIIRMSGQTQVGLIRVVEEVLMVHYEMLFYSLS